MKKVLFFFIIFFIIIILSSCQYFRLMSQNEWAEMSERGDENVVIYVAGERDDGTSLACYWKVRDNNIGRIDLDNADNGYGNSIYVINKNVYVCGINFIGGDINACLWINRRCYYLNLDLGPPAYANKLFVKNGIVFIAGEDNAFACYWINRDKMNLDSVNISTANDIYINQISSSKHITYIGGSNMLGRACYWKDGKITDLPGGDIAASSVVEAIEVVGNIVYSAGSVTIGASTYPAFWKNTKCTVLSGSSGTTSDIFVSNEDVYVAGETPVNIACYWKNNTYYPLPSTGNATAESIFIYNDNVYIAGQDGTDACYWVNNEQVLLDPGIISSDCYSIYVTTNVKD